MKCSHLCNQSTTFKSTTVQFPLSWATIRRIVMATQSLTWSCEGRENGTANSVCCADKLCCYSNMPKFCRPVFACHENTLAVDSENPFIIFMVSKLTMRNPGQLKMSPNSVRCKHGNFGFGPLTCRKYSYINSVSIMMSIFLSLENESSPWWMVDMEYTRCVSKVKILNRVGTCNHGDEPDCGEHYGRKNKVIVSYTQPARSGCVRPCLKGGSHCSGR